MIKTKYNCPKIIFSLLCLLFISIQAKAEEQHYSIFVKAESDKIKVKKSLNQYNIQVVAEGSEFLVISDIKSKEFILALPKLQNNKFVKAIKKNRKMVPLIKNEFEQENACHEKQEKDLGLKAFQKLNGDFNSISSDGSCHISKRCDNGLNPNWAKEQVGADLAENMINQLKATKNITESAATVAVVDSGFDSDSNKGAIEALSVNTYKGHKSSGNENYDLDGHGTAVAGMISAKGSGITKNVHLRVYRATKDYGNGSVSSGLLDAAIEKACAESDIVNVSWGSLADETTEVIDPKNEPWFKKAKEKGCIIVKAAGNWGVKKAKEFKVAPEDPFVSVAASNQYMNEASFTTKGMVRAPGESTFTLLSNQHAYGASTLNNSCIRDGIRLGPINGTSFASPAVAGMMGQALTFLRLKGVIPPKSERNMEPKEVALLKSLLKLSSQLNSKGIVNSFAALKIADQIKKGDDYSQEALGKIVDRLQQKSCHKKFKHCPSLRQCSEKVTCVNKLRESFSLCQNIKSNLSKVLSNELAEMSENELLNALESSKSEGNITKERLAELWEENLEGPNDEGEYDLLSIKEALRIFEIAKSGDFSDFWTEERIRTFIQSGSLSYNMGLSTKGGDVYHENRIRLMHSLEAIPEDKKDIFFDVISSHEKSMRGVASILVTIRDYTADSIMRDKASDILNKISTKWLEGAYQKQFFDIDEASIDQIITPSQQNELKEMILQKKEMKPFIQEYILSSKSFWKDDKAKALYVMDILENSPIERKKDLGYNLSSAVGKIIENEKELNLSDLKITKILHEENDETPDAKTTTEKDFWSVFFGHIENNPEESLPNAFNSSMMNYDWKKNKELKKLNAPKKWEKFATIANKELLEELKKKKPNSRKTDDLLENLLGLMHEVPVLKEDISFPEETGFLQSFNFISEKIDDFSKDEPVKLMLKILDSSYISKNKELKKKLIPQAQKLYEKMQKSQHNVSANHYNIVGQFLGIKEEKNNNILNDKLKKLKKKGYYFSNHQTADTSQIDVETDKPNDVEISLADTQEEISRLLEVKDYKKHRETFKKILEALDQFTPNSQTDKEDYYKLVSQVLKSPMTSSYLGSVDKNIKEINEQDLNSPLYKILRSISKLTDEQFIEMAKKNFFLTYHYNKQDKIAILTALLLKGKGNESRTKALKEVRHNWLVHFKDKKSHLRTDSDDIKVALSLLGDEGVKKIETKLSTDPSFIGRSGALSQLVFESKQFSDDARDKLVAYKLRHYYSAHKNTDQNTNIVNWATRNDIDPKNLKRFIEYNLHIEIDKSIVLTNDGTPSTYTAAIGSNIPLADKLIRKNLNAISDSLYYSKKLDSPHEVLAENINVLLLKNRGINKLNKKKIFSKQKSRFEYLLKKSIDVMKSAGPNYPRYSVKTESSMLYIAFLLENKKEMLEFGFDPKKFDKIKDLEGFSSFAKVSKRNKALIKRAFK